MTTELISLGPRVSKEDFMRTLGLEAGNPHHEHYYRAMRDDAIAVYNILNRDSSSLIDSIQLNSDVKPPYFWHHIRPERQQWAILEIWMRSGPITRPFFDRGATSGEYGPNWVSYWLLYSVFRSRDIRNNRNRRKHQEARRASTSSTISATITPTTPRGSVVFYDPVREGMKILT